MTDAQLEKATTEEVNVRLMVHVSFGITVGLYAGKTITKADIVESIADMLGTYELSDLEACIDKVSVMDIHTDDGVVLVDCDG